MGLLDKLKPKSPVEKAAKQVREPYAQPDYRRGAMDKLLEIGTDEAYAALLQRFTINAHGQIADEDEKRDLVERLVATSEASLPAVKKFIREQKKHITFPVRALVRMLEKEDAIAFLENTLQQYEPLDHRTTPAKLTLVTTLGELVGSERADLFVPYLSDHDDDVQLAAVTAIERLQNPDTREALLEVCTGEEHAPRVKRRAAQALVDLGWSAKDGYADFDEELKAEYLIGKKGQLVHRKPKDDEEG